MNNVNKTLYIPLYGKAVVSKKGIILHDRKAEEIWEKEGFPLKGKMKSKWLAYNMGMRSAVFDCWIEDQLSQNPDAVVLYIGCGMDSRISRVKTQGHMWYDIDFPDVINQRKKHYEESDHYHMLPADVRNVEWVKELPAGDAVVIMEGVSMYMKPEELTQLFTSLCEHFHKVSLLIDCYSVFAAKMSKYKNPVNEVGVTTLYGIDDPTSLEISGLKYAAEHELTPQNLIDELKGFERMFFKTMFAGSLAKKAYRLYEYRFAGS